MEYSGPGCYDDIDDRVPEVDVIFEEVLPKRDCALRPQQRAFASSTSVTLCAGHRLLAEVPCGVGKSYGYSYPAALEVCRPVGAAAPVMHRDENGDVFWVLHDGSTTTSRKQVVIATAGLTLQDQLVRKDLPMVKKVMQEDLHKTFDYALLKGWSNYYCPAQAELEGAGQSGDTYAQLQQVEQIKAWAITVMQDKGPGDRAELSFEPDVPVWRRFSISSDDCLKKACRFYKDCPAQRARQAARQADVVVTNHHLVVSSRGHLTPTCHLVLDEVHELPDIARDLWGFRLVGGTLIHYVDSMEKLAVSPGLKTKLGELKVSMRTLWQRFDSTRKALARSQFDREIVIEAHHISYATDLFAAWAGELPELLSQIGEEVQSFRVQQSMKGKGPSSDRILSEDTKLDMLRRRIERVTLAFQQLTESPNDFALFFSGPPEKLATLEGKYIEIGTHIQDLLTRYEGGVVGVSATVTASLHSFEYMRKEMGFEPKNIDLLEVDTPFDFRKNALLVLPKTKNTDPNSDEWRREMGALALRVVQESQGRTLLLFTSLRSVDEVHKIMAQAQESKQLPRPGAPGGIQIYRQGDMPKASLIEAFKKDKHSILLGTTSLWTGVDVPGEALSTVFVDKIPFPMQSDPILQAVTKRSDSWFQDYMFPRALLALKQGVGRLIRTVTDRGVVVLADPRMHTKSYNKQILQALPPMRVTNDIGEIGKFLGQAPRAK